MINDLVDFVREHKPFTAAFLLMNIFAVLIFTGHGYVIALYLLGFILSYIWFAVFAAISLLKSYERKSRS